MTPRTNKRRPFRMLLGEDHGEVRHLLAHIFGLDGFDVVEAGTGIDLLRWLAPGLFEEVMEHFDVVVSDIRIPGLTALEVLSGLEIGDLPPVFLITAFGGEAVHRRALELGVRAVFDKPFDVDVLRAAVLRAASVPNASE